MPSSESHPPPAFEAGPAEVDRRALLSALNDEDPVTRTRAARAIGRSGHAGPGGTAALAGALADPDPMVRAMAAWALGRIGPLPDAARAALAALLADPVPPVRFWACTSIGRLGGPWAPETLDALRALREDGHPAVRHAAAVALRTVSRAAGPARGEEAEGR